MTSVVPAKITGQGVESPSLTGSMEIVTINVYFACLRRYKRGQKKSFQRAIRVTAAHDDKYQNPYTRQFLPPAPVHPVHR